MGSAKHRGARRRGGKHKAPRAHHGRTVAAASTVVVAATAAPAGAYTVKAGDTLSELAARNDTSVARLARINGLDDPDKIYAGDHLRLHPARRRAATQVNRAAPRLSRGGGRHALGPIPAAGTWSRHAGYSWAIGAWDINIPGSADYGDPVRAARPGRVVGAQRWSYSYGHHVTIANDDGTRSIYAHMSAMFAHQGERVRRGDLIGRVGATGNATGPHLHYEIRR